jgi:hypothetical protein
MATLTVGSGNDTDVVADDGSVLAGGGDRKADVSVSSLMGQLGVGSSEPKIVQEAKM